VNLGLRYELPPNYHSTDDNSGWGFDFANGGSLSWVSQSFVNSIQQSAASQGLTPYAPYLNCCVPNTLVPIDKKDFAPHIGLAWRPFATDRFVVRAGCGIFYDTYMRYYNLVQNFDNNQLQTEFANNTYSSGTGFESVSPEPSLNQLWLPTISSAQFFSTTQPWNSPGFSSPILNQVNWPQNHNPYNQQWTLDTQFAVRPDLLPDIGRVDNTVCGNPPIFCSTPPRRPAFQAILATICLISRRQPDHTSNGSRHHNLTPVPPRELYVALESRLVLRAAAHCHSLWHELVAPTA
jgi:hypothetical protein